MPHPHDSRHLLTAETLSIGTELTVGDTRDTNAGELARAMTAMGLRVGRMTALPDDLATVTEAFRAAMTRSDVVVSTGGLGPTPDDLTREAISAAVGETVAVDPAIERWLRRLWSRRGMPFPELNLKQAWLIPSAAPLANPNGTAPGWFVTRADGGAIVALPGPPREMRPMWHDHVVPRLLELGAGADVAAITYRLTGIGESQVADLLGEPLLRATNPIVATYARAEAVDVRISATATADATAADLVEPAAAIVREALGAYVWATGDTTWAAAIGDRLQALGWTVAIVEIGTGGQVGALLGDAAWIRASTTLTGEAAGPGNEIHERGDGIEPGTDQGPSDDSLLAQARRAREAAGAEVGLAVHASRGTDDTAVSIAVATPASETVDHRTAFLGGANGRIRAALAAAAVLLASLDLPRGAPKP